MKFDILTIFPHILDSYLHESILKKSQDKGLLSVAMHDIRDYTDDKHNTVDDSPYGGGPGMVYKVEPIYKCLQRVKAKKGKTRVIILSPSGKQFTQKKAQELSKYDQVVFITGRYEGIDARVEKFVDESISIGPYVLSGGELPALVVLEAISRYIPGVLGKEESLEVESHGILGEKEYPHYTRPEVFEPEKGKKLRVPKVLLSGDHKKVEEWRKKKMQ